MLESFQLAAIIRQGVQTHLRRIPLHQALQENLAESWEEQYETFMDDKREIDFNAGYKPEENEYFCLQNYGPPDWLSEEDSQTISDSDAIGRDQQLFHSIKGIAAFAQNDQGEEMVLCQNFSQSRVIRPGRYLFLEADTYRSSERPGLTLDRRLSAVYLPADRKLLFKSFRTVNSFLPLTDFYEEASEQTIREILDHELLAPEDPGALAIGADQWSRKRFAMLKDSGVLDNYSAQEIQSRSNGYDVSIHISNGKIVFPSDKPAVRKLLQFLNEELFRGAITETLYETNSKRQADQ